MLRKANAVIAKVKLKVRVAGVMRSARSTHGDVEDGDHVEGGGEDGAHAFD